MPRRASGLVLLAWFCFLCRAGWHAALLPLWEGFDEWAHVAYIQRLAAGQGLPLPGQTRISREVRASLGVTPMPAVPLSTPHHTHGEYWRLPPAERAEMRSRLTTIPRNWALQEDPAGELNYEAQQPPLYYFILAPIERVFAPLPLPDRVLALRLVGVLLASLVVPLTCAAIRTPAGSVPAAAGAALVAAMPLPAMTASRVGNDALSMVLFAALLWVLARAGPQAGFRHAFAAGVLLGAGLLTKAYFLTAIPALATLYGWRLVRRPGRRAAAAAQAAVLFGTAGLLSFWWYWRSFRLTGSWSGLQQTAGQSSSIADLLQQALHVNWPRFAEISFRTHLWIGHWSFLQLRAWMYGVFAVLYLLAAAGLLLLWLRRRKLHQTTGWRDLGAAALIWAWFWVGLAYHEVTFARLGLSSSAGWYAVAVISAETVLLSAGWAALVRGRLWFLAVAAALFALLDLYATNFLLIPYYTGLIAHEPSGRLASFHLSQLAGGGAALFFGRAGGILPLPLNVTLWCLHAAATIALPLVALKAARSNPR
ncbi:MAG: glycosyltransferase family 39 protein [Bryobacteraceae bacterium]|nr:glycosyltransferase family 39 protein [Bryobacteraceae bacterium]